MKYTDCIPGKIYKTWFRAMDYHVVVFEEADENGYFRGKGVYIGADRNTDEDNKTDRLNDFKRSWTFEEPSESDLVALYKEYPELNKNVIYELY